MFIVPKIDVLPASIISSNLTDVADYNVLTTYAEGDRVKDPVTFAEYKSVVDNNTGNALDEVNSTYWTRTGFANSYRIFDGFLAEQSENADEIVVEVDIGQLFTAVSFHKVSAASITVEIKEGGSTVYTETRQMVRTDDTEDIWDHFFTEPELKTDVVFPSVPGHSGNTLKITVSAPGSTAKVGEVIVGYKRQLGDTAVDSGPRIKDFSTKERNEWGDFYIQKRAYSRGASFKLALEAHDTDRVTRILERNQAKICLFFPGDDMEHYGLTVVGICGQFEPGLPHRGKTIVNVPIEGISQ